MRHAPIAADQHNPAILATADDHDMRAYIQRCLSDSVNCHVALIRGSSDIDCVRELIPDLIICDVTPGQGGFAVAKQLRNDARTSHIPIVMLTAGATKEPRLRGCEEKFLARLDDTMAQHYQKWLFGPDQMAAACAMSPRQLQRKLKALTNSSPANYLREYRLTQAAARLRDGYPVSVVSDQCGFSSPSQFSRSFKARYGVAPKRYQQSRSSVG